MARTTRTLAVASALVALALAGCHEVVSVTPAASEAGATIEIAGTGFGDSQGNGGLTYDGVEAQVLSWSDTVIETVVPAGKEPGFYTIAVVVRGKSATIEHRVVPPRVGPDSDVDGLSDAYEALGSGTDPGQRDSDGDGVEDGVEDAFGGDPTDPAVPGASTDSDGDLTPDAWDPSPTDADVNRNGILDGWEYAAYGELVDVPGMGDVNGDGYVDEPDVAYLLELIRGEMPLLPGVLERDLDVDRDGRILREDVIHLAAFLRGIQPTLPVQ